MMDDRDRRAMPADKKAAAIDKKFRENENFAIRVAALGRLF